MKTSSNFDPTPWLSPFDAATYLEPTLLEPRRLADLHPCVAALFPDRLSAAFSQELSGDDLDDDKANHQLLWSKRVPLCQQSTPKGVVGNLGQWDAKHRLHLAYPRCLPRIPHGEICEVPKDASSTRVVFNRIPRNTFELHLSGASETIPAAHALVDLFLPSGSVARISSEDLSDYYPSFIGTLDRAHTNVLAKTVAPAQFQGTKALQLLQATCRRAGKR